MCRLKLSRLFCLLFALSVFLGSFGLSASAASDNLIDSNLTHWQNLSDKNQYYIPCTITSSDNIYRVTVNAGSSSNLVGAVYDYGQLIAGHSYSLSFKMPTRSAINLAFDKDYSANVFTNHFTNCTLSIGIAFLSPSNEIISSESFALYTITSENYTDFFGKTLTTSFIASNFSGTPVVIIQLIPLDSNNHSFYFSDFKLVDNDDNSAELTGIKGFLHSIRWDLVGGTCEEEDCPHSAAGNPHLSLSERMSSGFALMFQSIGDKFEEGSTLNTWFTGLSDKVGSINGSLTGLGDRINGFFSGLGDRISGFFSSLGDRMSGFFTDLKTNMSTWFSELGNKITTKFQEIGDKFTEFFEKFKPRVYINFDWQQGWVNHNNGQIYIDIYEPGQFFEQGRGYCLITDYFEVPSDCLYKLDFIADNTLVYVLKYDLSGNFIDNLNTSSTSFEGFELESGYKYIFQIQFRSNYPSDDEMDDRCNDSVLVYADEGWINALLYNLKMSIKGLFVPDAQFITEWKTELEELLQDRLGIIWDAGDFFVSLIQTIGDLLTTTADDIHYELPEMEIELNGETYLLWQAQQVDFSFLKKNAFFSMLYKLYKSVLNVLLAIPLLNYAKKEMDATLHN